MAERYRFINEKGWYSNPRNWFDFGLGAVIIFLILMQKCSGKEEIAVCDCPQVICLDCPPCPADVVLEDDGDEGEGDEGDELSPEPQLVAPAPIKVTRKVALPQLPKVPLFQPQKDLLPVPKEKIGESETYVNLEGIMATEQGGDCKLGCEKALMRNGDSRQHAVCVCGEKSKATFRDQGLLKK